MATYAQTLATQIAANNAARIREEEARKARARIWAEVVEDMDEQQKADLDVWWDDMMEK